MKKITGDIILLMRTKNQNHMVPEIRSLTEFVVISGHFFPFYPSNDLENQNLKK